MMNCRLNEDMEVGTLKQFITIKYEEIHGKYFLNIKIINTKLDHK